MGVRLLLLVAACSCKAPPQTGPVDSDTDPADDTGSADDTGPEEVVDADGDGWPATEDCDDDDPSVNPGAAEICDNGVDDDCSGDTEGCRPEGLYHESAYDLRWDGEDAGSESGRALCAGDLDADGLADVAIGAPVADGKAGRIYLAQSGGGSLSEAPTVLVGAAEDDQAGRDVACGADLDGDGVGDLLVGIRGYDGGAEDAGGFVVVPGPLPAGVGLLHDEGTVWTSTHLGELAGSTVSFAEVTGDDAIDVLLGAPLSDRSGVAGGAGFVVAGPITAAGSLTEAAAVLHGREKDDFAGQALAAAGDVDGDGVGDLLMGAWGSGAEASFGGLAYLVLGPLDGESALADADKGWRGRDDWMLLGYAVASAGDLDDDGHDDVLIAAPGAYLEETSEGLIYVLTDPLEQGLDSATAVLVGPHGSARAGWSLQGDLDVDGDDQTDVFVGVPAMSYTSSNAGGGLLAYGPLSGTVDLANFTLGLTTDELGVEGGFAVAGGDLDGDGLDDLLLGIPHAGGGETVGPGAVGGLLGGGW